SSRSSISDTTVCRTRHSHNWAALGDVPGTWGLTEIKLGRRRSRGGELRVRILLALVAMTSREGEIRFLISKEHIANIEQIVYKRIARTDPPRRRAFSLSALRIVVIRRATWPRPRYVSLKEVPWTSRKPSTPRCPRSSAISARARS